MKLVTAIIKPFKLDDVREALNGIGVHLTMGGGLKFLVFDLNFAVFTRELGAHIGDKPLSGMSMDAAIRW